MSTPYLACLHTTMQLSSAVNRRGMSSAAAMLDQCWRLLDWAALSSVSTSAPSAAWPSVVHWWTPVEVLRVGVWDKGCKSR